MRTHHSNDDCPTEGFAERPSAVFVRAHVGLVGAYFGECLSWGEATPRNAGTLSNEDSRIDRGRSRPGRGRRGIVSRLITN